HHPAAGPGLAEGIDAAAADHGASMFHAWDDDPIATGIESVGNVVLMLVPGAGAARFAGLSARASRWARITAAGADFVIPGGSFAVAGSVRVVSNLADAAQLSGRVTGLRLHPAGVVDVLTDSFRHTPVSAELFAPPAASPCSPAPSATARAPASSSGRRRRSAPARSAQLTKASPPARWGTPSRRGRDPTGRWSRPQRMHHRRGRRTSRHRVVATEV